MKKIINAYFHSKGRIGRWKFFLQSLPFIPIIIIANTDFILENKYPLVDVLNICIMLLIMYCVCVGMQKKTA